MKKIFNLIIVTIMLIVSSFSVACFEGSEEFSYVSEPQMYTEYNEYLGWSAKVRGTLVNNTSKTYSYVQIEFSIYDAAGNNLGTALDNVNNIAPGDKWSFTANLFDFPSNKPASFKLVDITAW